MTDNLNFEKQISKEYNGQVVVISNIDGYFARKKQGLFYFCNRSYENILSVYRNLTI